MSTPTEQFDLVFANGNLVVLGDKIRFFKDGIEREGIVVGLSGEDEIMVRVEYNGQELIICLDALVMIKENNNRMTRDQCLTKSYPATRS